MQNIENKIILYYLKNIFKTETSPLANRGTRFQETCINLLTCMCDFNVTTDDKSTQIYNFLSDIHVDDITDYNFDKNISIIANAFNVPMDVWPVFQFFVYLLKYKSLNTLIYDGFWINHDNIDISDNYTLEYIAQLCNVPETKISQFFACDGPLVNIGIMKNDFGNMKFTPDFKQLITQEFKTQDDVIDTFLGHRIKTPFTPKNFDNIKPDFDNVAKLLHATRGSNTANINILVSGPGIMCKREFIASVCDSVGLKAYESTDGFYAQERMDALIQTQEKLKHFSDSVVVINWASGILITGQQYAGPRSTLMQILHNNHRPVIWMVDNDIKLHPDLLFAFSLIVKIPDVDKTEKKRCVEHLLEKYEYEISDKNIYDFIMMSDIPAEILENAIKNAKITNDDNMIKYTIKNQVDYIKGEK